MSRLKRTITDDRGNEREPINIADLKRDADDQNSTRKDLARYLQHVVRVESRRSGSRPMTIFIMVSAVVAGTVLLVLTRGTTFQIPGFPLVLLGVVLVRHLTKRRIGQQLAATVVAEGFCGSCTYSLRSMPTEADGCTVCAECGAAWRKERITTPHWARPDLLPPVAMSRWQRMLGRVPRERELLTEDSRGRFVRALDPWLVLLPDDRRQQLGPEAVAAMRRRIRGNGRLGRWAVASAIMLSAAAGCTLLLLLLGRSAWPWVAALAGSAPLFALVTIVGNQFCPPAKCVALLIQHFWCGSCGRDLSALTPAKDGCITCPACSASWRLAPPTKPLPEATRGGD